MFSGFGNGAFSSFLSDYDMGILERIQAVIRARRLFFRFGHFLWGEALIDPGAGEDLVGLRSFDQFEKALSLGGKLGFVKTKVLDCDIPHLLSVGLLDHVGSIVDLPRDRILFDDSSEVSACRRLESGHRTLNILPSRAFSKEVIPPQMCEDLNLKPQDFQSAEQYKVRQVSHDMSPSNCLVPSFSTDQDCFVSSSQTLLNGRKSQQCSSDSCSVSFPIPRHGEGSCSSSLEEHGDSSTLCAQFRPESACEVAFEPKEDEMPIHCSSTSRLDSEATGLCSSSIPSTPWRQSIWSLGNVSEVFGQSELSSHVGSSQSQEQEEGRGTGTGNPGTSTNSGSSAEPIIYQRPHSGDCCDCHLSDQGHVRELPQSHAGSDDSVRSSFAAAVPRSSSSMASTCISLGIQQPSMAPVYRMDATDQEDQVK